MKYVPITRFTMLTRLLLDSHTASRDPFAVIFLLCALAGCGSPAPATNVQLHSLFTDHMLLQRDQVIIVWGWAEPGGVVSAAIAGQESSARVRSDSSWRLTFGSLAAGGPYELQVMGADTVLISDVMVGEVWVASGQSNMEWPVARSMNAEQEIEAANHPDIRLFTVTPTAAPTPSSDLDAKGWAPVTSESIAAFSGVAYFFGRQLQEDLSVPIGLIQSAWGGTPAEAWTSASTLRAMPDFVDAVEALEQDPGMLPRDEEDFQLRWLQAALEADPGRLERATWAETEPEWDTVDVPGRWGETPQVNDGVGWFRKVFMLPSERMPEGLDLHLGWIMYSDSVWVNGVPVGGTIGANETRKYPVPADVLRPGSNVVTVRVVTYRTRIGGLSGGIFGEPAEVFLGPIDGAGGPRIPLNGDWKFLQTFSFRDVSEPPPWPKRYPSALYNGMIAPLLNYGIRGVILYQGEANADRAHQYRSLFPAMIRDWRQSWKLGDFPFLFVQIANHLTPQETPVEEGWGPELREAQTLALELPNTAMVVTFDTGGGENHPPNKQVVGRRLALAALGSVYGRDVVYSGPRYRSMEKTGRGIRLHFDNVGGGLVSRGDTLRGFAVAGADRRFVWAEARIDGDAVVVSSQEALDPVAVRYAWANNPILGLFNREGLPAPPFRTDDWPLTTEGNR